MINSAISYVRNNTPFVQLVYLPSGYRLSAACILHIYIQYCT